MRRLTVAFVVVVLPLVAGGAPATGEELPPVGTFAPAGSLSEARDLHTATLLPDGSVFVIGGGHGDDVLASAEVWDPVTSTFGPAVSLPEARERHTATLLPDSRVLVVGGNGDDVLASAEVWDPLTSTFNPAGSLTEGRGLHTATLLPDGRVLVVGGTDGVAALASAEVWDPVTSTLSPAGSLTEGRTLHTATLLPDGRVLVVGGTDGVAALALAEVWDPATASFGPAGLATEPRLGHTATLLPDGHVLVVGGADGVDVLSSAEVWDPATASFGPSGSTAEPRLGHTATLLPDGRVLVVGGTDGVDALASAEVWDPVTASFGPEGSLPEARANHTATLLPDGRVLVIGGWDGDEYLASTEAWSPLTPPLPSADPLTAVTAFLDALVAKKWDSLPLLVCASQRDSVANSFGGTDAATEQLVDMMQISISGTSVTPMETSGSTATVTIDGQLSVQIPDEAWRTYFGRVNANADPSPAPSEIDQFVAQVQAQSQGLTLAPEVTVVNESGGWLVCSEILSSATAPPPSGASPVPSPTASPMPSPIASPAPVATAEELAAACDGNAVPGAASFAGRAHPLVVVLSSGAIDADLYHVNTRWVDDAWPGPIQLVLCVDPVQRPVKVGSCGRYKRVTDGKVGQVNRFRYAQVVRVVLAGTGETLQSKTIYGRPPTCTRKVALTSAPPPWRIYGDDVSDGAVNRLAVETSRQKVR